MKNAIALIFTAGAFLLTGCATCCHHASTAWEYQIIDGHLPKLNEKIAELARDGWQVVFVTPTDNPPGGFQSAVVTLKRSK